MSQKLLTGYMKRVEDYFNQGVPELRNLPLVTSYKYPLCIAVCYVAVVKFIGPAVMRRRNPLDLRPLMVVYNFGLVALYVHLLGQEIIVFLNMGWDFFCTEFDASTSTPSLRKLMYLAYDFYILKYIELLDTVFLVVSKKFHMITSLHVIHHSILPVACFLLIRTERGTYLTVYGLVNGSIHVIMYLYYGLAALGPRVQKYLWWKKYLTMLQIGQFVFMSAYMTAMWYAGCATSGPSLWFLTFFTLLVLWMFVEYYQASLQTRNKKKP